MDELDQYLNQVGESACRAGALLSLLPRQKKDEALRLMACELETAHSELMAANRLDVEAAEQKGISAALIDRLLLTPQRIMAMAEGLRKVASLEDPVGRVLEQWTQPNNLHIEKVSVPIGVIGMIYESRPNVTADAAALCFKAGNAVILKGGSDARHSNRAIADALHRGLGKAGIDTDAIQLIDRTEREVVVGLCHLDTYLDLLIPRGGRSLIETVVGNARMPVIKHYDGICHLYVDKGADTALAVNLADDGKTQRPGACNALETLLVHKSVLPDFLPLLQARMQERAVELRACPRSLPSLDGALSAVEEDWGTEYLDLVLSIKVVDSLREAISHINRYGSHHSDAIVTEEADRAGKFLSEVRSACVYHNASTRFSDGEEFGFGAEIGISTDKLHARGPMGLRELTSYQYRIRGEGQVKEPGRLPR